MLQKLAEKWLEVELSHNVSKAASNTFWEHAMSLIPPLLDVKHTRGITRKIPQFIHLRRKLKLQLLPSIDTVSAFRNEGGDVVVAEDQKKANEFTTSNHIKLYESTGVKVRL